MDHTPTIDILTILKCDSFKRFTVTHHDLFEHTNQPIQSLAIATLHANRALRSTARLASVQSSEGLVILLDLAPF